MTATREDPDREFWEYVRNMSNEDVMLIQTSPVLPEQYLRTDEHFKIRGAHALWWKNRQHHINEKYVMHHPV